MTAALTTAARVVLAIAGGLAFAAAFAAAVVWAGFGPQDGRMLAFLGAMCVVVVGAGLGLAALQPNGDGDYPEDWQEQGWCCRECAVTAWYAMSPELRREFAAHVPEGRDHG